LSAVLLLFALIPLAATIQASQNSYASTPLNCQPGVQNQYPETANSGQKIVIITTVTSACVTEYNEVIVNILLPNTSRILSTAPASPAINTVTAPATGGPWSLIVQVLWIYYYSGGTMAIFQTTITIKINGPLASSTVTSRTASSTKFTSSRIAASSSVKVSSSTVLSYSTVISSKNFTSTNVSSTITNKSTFNTSSTLPSNPFSNILPYIWQHSTGALILAVVVILLIAGIFALKRRRRETGN
jgi:hypothetical protein